MVTPVVASNNQGLDWGVNVGDRYDYLLSSKDYLSGELETELVYRAYLIVEGLLELPLTVTTLNQVWWYTNYSCYYEDGTAYPNGENFIWVALPIGNWSLIADLFAEQWSSPPDTVESVYMIDTPALWGYNLTQAMTDWNAFISETFLKSSGVLYNHLYSVNLTGTPVLRDEIAYLSGPPRGYDTLFVIGFGVAGVVGLVVVSLFLKKRGQPNISDGMGRK